MLYSRMNDRTPAIEIDDALKLLSERYGFKRVRCLATGNVVFVDMLLESGATFIAVLTTRRENISL